MKNMIDTTLLDGLLVGRTEPQIYAFTTETVPNYLKVGDTYRPVSERLKEWERHYPQLKHRYTHTAMLQSGLIFRDYAIHQFLEQEMGLHRLLPSDLPKGVYYSREFFQNATTSDIDEAIADIKKSEKKADGRYQLYSPDRLPVRLTYERNQTFLPRNNQQEAIDRFKEAVAKGRTNLLMYAVMRFGKSFTAMCCATEIAARLVLVVSAKADVRKEWKRTVESHVRFAGYTFLDGSDLTRNQHIITEKLAQAERMVVFLTLQDLQGDTIKEKHAGIFTADIDLLLVDETHFGARAAEYGKVLQENHLNAKEIRKELQGADTIDGLERELKTLNAKVRMHLSGTPYRILMGDEFTKDDIIAFCQYTDIVDAKEAWDAQHGTEDGMNEWDNPYYGFPQMLRFAFHLNTSSLKRLEELRRQNIKYTFSALFKPKSLTKTRDGLHKVFQYEKEIRELLEVLDGSRRDENLLGFLDLDKLKQGKMCRHMVCVLPFRASCDALAALLASNKKRLKNLSTYEIINIAGVDNEHRYQDTESVKRAIKDCEARGQKTLTLTVNRMLTGSTVEEWDTMLYFKDTASPQEYDQAVFRIQNQYVKAFVDESGNAVRYNMKPQTLLVDFDPARMFRLQEQKSQFYNANVERQGNTQLRERMKRELVISPIVCIQQGMLKRVEATDIMEAVREYSSSRSMFDEATDIPADLTLLNDAAFRSEIAKVNPIDSNHGIEVNANEGDDETGDDLPDINIPSTTEKDSTTPKDRDNEKDKEEDISKKIAAYYMRILLYAFLTESQVNSLEDVIRSITDGDTANKRIAKAVGLKVSLLELIQAKCNPFVLSKLDYKVQNINSLMRDTSLAPIERAMRALKKFARLSDAEVVTPPMIADELVGMLPEEAMTDGSDILDIAAVQGEFACAIYKKYGLETASRVYALPTSPLTAELTRKIYGLLGLPTDHVLSIRTSDLLNENKAEDVGNALRHNIGTVLGVPPLGKKRGGGRNDGREATYQHYYFYARDVIAPRTIAMMTQSTWYSGGRGQRLEEFRKDMLDCGHIKELHDYPDFEAYFKGVTTLRGGICLFLWDRQHEGRATVVNHICHKDYTLVRPMRYTHGTFRAEFFIRWNMGLQILDKVLDKTNVFLPNNGLMYNRNPFSFPDTKPSFAESPSSPNDVKVYLAKGKVGYDKGVKTNPDGLLSKWKVLVAKASSGDDSLPHLVISKPVVSEPGSVTANTHYVVLPAAKPTQREAKNLADYMCTRFMRFMVMLLRSNQNMRVDMYQFAPRLDFKHRWTDAKLYTIYGITPDERNFIESIIKDMGSKQK